MQVLLIAGSIVMPILVSWQWFCSSYISKLVRDRRRTLSSWKLREEEESLEYSVEMHAYSPSYSKYQFCTGHAVA
jgi:hypothetical protein